MKGFLTLLFSILAISFSAYAQGFKGVVEVSDSDIERMDFGKAYQLSVPTLDGEVVLAFRPVPVRSPKYKAESEGDATVMLYTGKVRPRFNKQDFAKLSFFPDGEIDGLIRVNSVFYSLSSDVIEGRTYLSVSEFMDEQLDEELSCAAHASAAEVSGDSSVTSSGSSPTAAAAGLREIELGTQGDAPFYARFGSVTDANNRIMAFVNAVNGILETDLGITNKVVLQRMYTTSDPFTSSDSGVLLTEFRTDWSNKVSIQYDNAHLFSGRDFEGSVIGRAYLNAVCRSYTFGVNQFWRDDNTAMKVLFAHEQGHNLGANHDTQIMNSSLLLSATNFSQYSINEINNYLATVSCLSEAPVGSAPVLDSIGSQSVVEGSNLSLALSAFDADGDTLSYSVAPLPEGASMSAEGAFSYTPPSSVAGCGGQATLNLNFEVTDTAGNSDSELVEVTVIDNGVSTAPVLAQISDVTTRTGQQVRIQLNGSDADGDSITYSGAGLPSGSSLNPDTGVFTWTPSASQTGVYNVSFTVTDCYGLGSSQSASITVEQAPSPVISSLSPNSGGHNTDVQISGTSLSGGTVEVFFGSKSASITSSSSGVLSVKAPKQRRGTSDVSVVVVVDGVSSNSLTFTYSSSGGNGGGGGKGQGKGKR